MSFPVLLFFSVFLKVKNWKKQPNAQDRHSRCSRPSTPSRPSILPRRLRRSRRTKLPRRKSCWRPLKPQRRLKPLRPSETPDTLVTLETLKTIKTLDTLKTLKKQEGVGIKYRCCSQRGEIVVPNCGLQSLSKMIFVSASGKSSPNPPALVLKIMTNL